MGKLDRIYRRYFNYTPACWAMVLASLTLSVLGLIVMQRLAGGTWGAKADGWLTNQSVFLVGGVFVMVAVGSLNYLRIGRLAYPLFALTLLMLLAVLVLGHVGRHVGFIGYFFPERGGSYRWFRLPFIQLQPSEFLKITYILALARYLRYRKNYRRLRGLIGPFVFTILPIVLILLEPDLGTVLLLIPVLFVMLIAAGARVKHLAVIVVLAVIASPGLFLMTADYQRWRITELLLQSPRVNQFLLDHPRVKETVYPSRTLRKWRYSNQGFQLSHAKLALGSGGLLGYPGIDRPYVTSYKLPECHNDFIFSMIGHLFGLVGTVCVVLLYLVLSTGMLETAGRVKEPFGALIAVGAFAMIVTQALINMAVTVGLMPITGMTLPFVSYGGSSLLTFFILVGLAISVDRTRPMTLGPRPFVFRDDDDV